MNMKRMMIVMAALLAGANLVNAQTWSDAGDKIWTQPDTDDFSPEYTSGSTATFAGAGETVTIDAGGVTPGGVIVNNTGTYTFRGGSIGGIGSLTKTGAGMLIITNANSFSGGIVLNQGTLRLTTGSTAASLGDPANVVTFTGSSTFDAQQWNQTLSQGFVVNEGVTATFTGNDGRQITVNNALTGSGTVLVRGNGNFLLDFRSTSNTFSGDFTIASITAGYVGTLSMDSLTDTHGRRVKLGSTSAPGVFSYGTGAVVPLVLSQRQIELSGSTYNGTFNNNAANANATVTINNDLLITGVGNKTFTLGGTHTGKNTFAGVITDGSGSVISLNKAGAGRWIVSNTNNSYTGATKVSAGTLQISSINDFGVDSPIGKGTSGTPIVLGDANNTGTLLYTGDDDESERTIQVNSSLNTNTGGAGINNNGTGDLTFNANPFNAAYVNANNSTRILTLGGSKGGTIMGTIQNNSANSLVGFTKSGTGSWTLKGANTFTGASTLSGGGTLVLDYSVNDNSKLSTGAFTVSLANGGGGGTLILSGGSHTQVVASTSLANGTGLWIKRASGSSTLQLNAISRANGQNVMSLSEDSIASTDQTNGNGILGGWATVSNNWAVNSINGADGAIIGLTSYTTIVPTTGGDAAANYQLTGSHELTGNLTGNSLRIVNDADSDVLDMGSVTSRILTPGSGHSAGILYVGGYDNNYTITGAGTVRSASANNTLNVNVYTGTLTVNALLNNGTAATVKYGAGTLVVGGNNVATGPFWVLDGTVRLTHNNAAGTTAGGIGVQNGAALELTNSVAIGTEALTIVGTGVSNGGAFRNVAGNTSTYGGTVTIGDGGARINSDTGASLILTNASAIVTALFRAVMIGGSGDTTVSGVISGAGSLIKDGSGTLMLSGTNTYSGETIIDGGKLALGGHNVLNGKTVTLNGGTLDAGTYTNTLSTLTVSGSASLVLSPGAVLTFSDSSAMQWDGTLSLTGAFTEGTSLRFGTSSTGLTTEQLASLTATGYTLSLDANGYLTGKPAGTLISIM
jgi:autotransporter-associated beta strand protein